MRSSFCASQEVQENRYHRVERAYGAFQRSFVLPTMVDQEQVQATYHDGILELHLPKLETAKPRRIAIQSQDPSAVSQIGKAPACPGLCLFFPESVPPPLSLKALNLRIGLGTCPIPRTRTSTRLRR